MSLEKFFAYSFMITVPLAFVDFVYDNEGAGWLAGILAVAFLVTKFLNRKKSS